MADPQETTGTVETTAPEGEDADQELDVEDTLMHQVATLQEAVEGNVKWLGALEARVEAVEQQLGSQLALAQEYSRLDSEVSGLRAAFNAHDHATSAGEPDVAAEVTEGSLGTLGSGTEVMISGRHLVVVGPAADGTIKVRPWAGSGAGEYLPASTIPDEVDR